MPEKPTTQSSLDPALLSRLACPSCRGGLRQDGAHLLCAGCGRSYPIVEGIPVLIAERAEMADPKPRN